MAGGELRDVLLKAACERKTVTYGQLMQLFGFTRGGSEESVVSALSALDERERGEGAPGFAAIVVRKDTGFPGGGFFCWKDVPPSLRRPEGEAANPKLTRREREYVKGLQEEIWSYYQARTPRMDGQSRLEL